MTSGNYADIDWLRRKLIIKDEDEDPDLDDSIEAANRFVDDVLSRNSATIPVTDPDLLSSAEFVANAEAMRDYKLTKQDIETSNEWRKTREERIKALLDKIHDNISDNSQGQFVAVSSSYRSEPLKSRSG